ncbi:MAG: hypothetical protein J1F13_02095 [Prevotellaceae bacterium]|nr:hypothetical protein [Prevotellaceae bacterium]
MKKIYIQPTVESVKFQNMLLAASAPTSVNSSEADAVGFGEVLSKGDSKGDGFWED